MPESGVIAARCARISRAELQALERALDAIPGRIGSDQVGWRGPRPIQTPVVEVVGEPGIGKTRLLGELCRCPRASARAQSSGP